MKVSINEFITQDKLKLPGILYEPNSKNERVLINLHGNGSTSVFYSVNRSNTFGENLTNKGISFFTFNNRGAHYVKSLKRYDNDLTQEPTRIKGGTAYEIIKDCIYDIDAAIEFLEKLGYKEFYLIGHSTGANKICVYNHYKPKNKVKKYILAGGGDDTGIYYQMMGKKKFELALEKSKSMISKGKGERLVSKNIVDYMISYQSFLDTINPDGDYNTFPFFEYISKTKVSRKKLFRYFNEIIKPTLIIYGDQDEFAYSSVEECVDSLVKHQNTNSQNTYQIIEGADHGFDPYTEIFAEKVVEWLS